MSLLKLLCDIKYLLFQLVPVHLTKKFSTSAALLLTEVEELYERDLQTFCVERIVKPGPGEELVAVAMKAYR
jgi:hypothetical protein